MNIQSVTHEASEHSSEISEESSGLSDIVSSKDQQIKQTKDAIMDKTPDKNNLDFLGKLRDNIFEPSGTSSVPVTKTSKKNTANYMGRKVA